MTALVTARMLLRKDQEAKSEQWVHLNNSKIKYCVHCFIGMFWTLKMILHFDKHHKHQQCK